VALAAAAWKYQLSVLQPHKICVNSGKPNVEGYDLGYAFGLVVEVVGGFVLKELRLFDNDVLVDEADLAFHFYAKDFGVVTGAAFKVS
jgi:hypothetical protein